MDELCIRLLSCVENRRTTTLMKVKTTSLNRRAEVYLMVEMESRGEVL